MTPTPRFLTRIRRGLARRLGYPMPQWGGANPAERSPDEAAFFNVQYARQVVGRLVFRGGISGARVLEVGPGMDLGAVLILMGLGAEVAVVDPFPCPWDPYLHPEVYAATVRLATRLLPQLDPGPLRAAIRGRRHDVPGLIRLDCALESAAARGLAPFDHLSSNAVLEHLEEPERAFAAMHLLTRPGGTGWHQVDFRDHRDFDNPLAFLAHSEERFREEARAACYSFGNRWRLGETVACLQRIGFRVRVSPNAWSAPEAVQTLRPRLGGRFATMEDADLEVLGAAIHLWRVGE